MKLGDRIAERRRAKEMTQAQLAAAAEIDVRTLAVIEVGRQEPSVYTIELLATALECTPAYLMFGEA